MKPTIFSFTDYRDFLKAFYKDRKGENNDSVYQLNFHFFPLSKTPIKKD
jgi:hypothetical protein